jgi:hypothetical protein
MKSSKIFAASVALAAALAISAETAQAQGVATAAVVAGSIVSKAISSIAAKKNPQENWLKAKVIHFDSNSIIVREEANGMMIHTFTYAPELKDKMQQILDWGGYQYGDKVKILYQQGQTVALKVLGKPSKPL